MCKLSIIIPHYNAPLLLMNLLQTIPSAPDIQVIVIDDNSDKFYTSKLNKVKKYKNVEFYYNLTGIKGAGACRNIGINKAKGDWLLFADADDYFINNFYSIVKQYFNSEYDVVFFVPTSVNLNDGAKAKRHLNYKKRILNYKRNPTLGSENDLKYKFSVPWSKLINRDFIIQNNIKFDEVIASNDVMFSTQVGYHLKKFEVSREEIYCVTRSDGTLTRSMSKEIFESRLNVFINYNNYLKSKLTQLEYNALNIIGSKYLRMSLNFSLLEMIKVYFKFKKHNVKIVDYKMLNPFRLTKLLTNVFWKKIKGENLY